jgi:SAM-dependent methyltransferase
MRFLKKIVSRIVLECTPSYRAHRRNLELNRRFDFRFDVDTMECVEIPDMKLDPETGFHAVGYEPTPIPLVKRILKSLPVEHRDFIFIDIGSGKGLTLLLAAKYDFKKIVGVEVSAAISDMAIKNISRYHAKNRCKNIESVCSNGQDYHFPSENLIVYLYNPFDACVLNEVLSNIEAVFLNSTYKLFLVYINPIHLDLVVARSFFKLIGVNKNRMRNYAIFSNRL